MARRWTEGLKKELSQFMLGMKKVVADNKRESGASLDEGNRATSFEVYTRLCEEIFNGKGKDQLLACLIDSKFEFNYEKRKLCQYAYAAHPVEVG